MRIKRQIMRWIVAMLSFPTVFMRSQTRKQYFKKNVERFVGSFSKSTRHVFQEFDTMIEQLPYSDSERRKARMQFRMLYHFTGLEVEDYQTIGGLHRSSFFTKMFCNVSRWRQNTFQYSVNKYRGNNKNRALLDNKAQFNTLFGDLIGREWITSDATEEEITEFIQAKDNVIVKPLGGSSGKGIFGLDYHTFVKHGGGENYSLMDNLLLRK